MKNGNEIWDLLGDSRKRYRGPWAEIGKYWPGKEPIRLQDSLPCPLKKKNKQETWNVLIEDGASADFLWFFENESRNMQFLFRQQNELEENKFAHVVKHVVNFQKPLQPLRLEAQLMTRPTHETSN